MTEKELTKLYKGMTSEELKAAAIFFALKHETATSMTFKKQVEKHWLVVESVIETLKH